MTIGNCYAKKLKLKMSGLIAKDMKNEYGF